MDAFRPDDESLGSRADKVERIARYQRQDFVAIGVQDRDVVRTHNFSGNHAIAVLAAQRGQRDDIVGLDVSQRPEERIAVPGDSNVARLSRQRGAGDMPHSAPKGLVAGAFR